MQSTASAAMNFLFSKTDFSSYYILSVIFTETLPESSGSVYQRVVRKIRSIIRFLYNIITDSE